MPTLYYEVQVEFDIKFGNSRVNDIVAVCEEVTGHTAKTWGYICEGKRFRVLFLTASNTEASFIHSVLAGSMTVRKKGLIEVVSDGQAKPYFHPPYLFRIGSKVVASCDLDEIEFARMGAKGIVRRHDGPYEYRIMFGDGGPEHKLVTAGVTELVADAEVTGNVVSIV
jgi:hypothetical protein